MSGDIPVIEQDAARAEGWGSAALLEAVDGTEAPPRFPPPKPLLSLCFIFVAQALLEVSTSKTPTENRAPQDFLAVRAAVQMFLPPPPPQAAALLLYTSFI